MTQEHLITPSPKLVEQWLDEWHNAKVKHTGHLDYIAIQAANWGSNQELEACCDVLKDWGSCLSPDLHDARRPKPPSLKEKALLQLDTLNADLGMHGLGCDLSQIRRAIESLPS